MAGVLDRQAALSAPEPALSSLWRVEIDSASTIVLAESVTLSWLKVPSEGRFIGGKYQYFAGFAEQDGLAMTLYETHDYKVSEWLMNWQKQIYNAEKEVYGLPNIYRKQIVANLFSKSSQKPVKVVKYIDCWPTDRGPYDLNYSDVNGRVVIQAQFACNRVIE